MNVSDNNINIFKLMDNTCPFAQCEYESPSDFDCLECWTKAAAETDDWTKDERI